VTKFFDNKFAIVCEHIASDGAPINRAVHDTPLSDEDSGWQFSCGQDVFENDLRAAVWLVSEVVDFCPNLGPWLRLFDEIDFQVIIEKDENEGIWKQSKQNGGDTG
jgi:hypothetical protein